ncbi:hypothetical protein K438DRAFT_1817236 [Mycena galopus ATCC 62051]|nr:hypothetical protein K438DRAFT_1817236 [Mycena galopus ATCC 62051]
MHIAYPSTPNFKNFKTDYVRALDWNGAWEEGSEVEASRRRPPTRATFFGTVKLHGTNATIVFRNGNARHAQIQSRSWVIEDTKKDNCGTYALLSKAPLSSLIDQILAVRGQGDFFQEIYICGEIAGKGVQKGVAIVAMERFFAIFNIRIDGRWVDMRQYKDCGLPEHRVFNVAQYKTFEVDIDFRQPTTEVHDLMDKYTAEVYDACPFGAAFGIVWTMVRSPYMDESDGREFDETVLKEKNVDPQTANAVAQFADYALAERRYEQGIEYLEGEQARQGLTINGYDVKLTGAFIKWVTDDAIKEERNEMVRLGVPEKDARKEVSARARLWYARKSKEVVDGLTAP